MKLLGGGKMSKEILSYEEIKAEIMKNVDLKKLTLDQLL